MSDLAIGRGPAGVAAMALAAINLAGVLCLAWIAAYVLRYDGLMVEELSICAGLTAVLAGVTWGGLTLAKRGRAVAAIVLLAAGAVPTLAVASLWIYLETHPIAWR